MTIVSGVNIYIEAGVTIGAGHGRSTRSRFIGRDSSIGADCTIGPFADVPRESIVPEGTTVAGNMRMRCRSSEWLAASE